ncbi:hypothetical protein [Ferrovum myxofaciens]|jgi:hypothetical protein|uniref:Uncharacterized protein n=1 Tax=mine drainage metagenome TaxID=410659 RepID=A0A3P3ZML8_9ZZZZ|nr:hypothetical protein [Ferrovum myxofaciens]MBU6994996.1 hypothetical protein [Ferrovum myxofaciens]
MNIQWLISGKDIARVKGVGRGAVQQHFGAATERSINDHNLASIIFPANSN